MTLAKVLLSVLTWGFFAAGGWAQEEDPAVRTDPIGHRHHHHHHNPPHKTVTDAARFFTSRTGAQLPLPLEEDAFFFVVFGDRTGGPAEGVSVLADAVRDVNLLEPDLVMTVGDLVQGYNEAPAWLEQMQEFRGIMSELLCPWFPVAGNHDTYWRGPEGRKPEGEHDALFEMHFGPLWYAFEHKNCWFIALYSDEGDPETGEKDFRKPECQRMSPEQTQWLAGILEKARDADHVFLFLHHPRWLKGNYGDDWDRVHRMLVAAGNVSAVFAGHIHHMHYDARDGIEYVTLATVGGGQRGIVPSAGFLHQYHMVTVRKEQLAIAAVPVGQVTDVREITGPMQRECVQLAEQRPEVEGQVRLSGDGSGGGALTATWTNTASRPIEVTTFVDSEDSRWRMTPDHAHATLAPGESRAFPTRLHRAAAPLDDAYRPLELVARIEYLTEGFRYPIPERRVDIPVNAELAAPERPSTEHALTLDGRAAHARIAAADVVLPDGPLTLECWFRANAYGKRVGLVTKTEMSEYGIFVSGGQPSFSVFLGERYATAEGEAESLKRNTWHHVAGVFDGKEVRLYVDGRRQAAVPGSGTRRTNRLPLIIGADVDRNGNATSPFDGFIDEVRLSDVARYDGDRFTPQRRFEPDAHTRILLHMDGVPGPWLYDSSPQHVCPHLKGGARVVSPPGEAKK